jgi:hypothetical protein
MLRKAIAFSLTLQSQTRICAAYRPIKKEKKRGVEKDDNQKPKAIPNRKKYSPKRWVVYRKNQFMAQQVQETIYPL